MSSAPEPSAMTAHAIRMTEHASSRQVPPTFAAGTIRAFLDALARLGHDVTGLMDVAGLQAGDLEDPDARVSCDAIGALLARAQRIHPIANLDLRLAMETPLGAYPLLDYLVLTSDTVGEGLRRLARHPELSGAPLEVDLFEAEAPVRVVISAPFTVFLAILHLRREAAEPWSPEYVSLRDRPEDPEAIERTLGCPVRAEASWNGFALSLASWRLPLRRRDPALQGVLERHAADVVARLPRGTGVVSEVRRALAPRIARGDVRLQAVARELGTSPRTLQRRLGEAGTSYLDLLEQARCDAAERHLAETLLSVAEISWLVGYSEPSAFQRAFKRWRGQSPRSFRDEVRTRRTR